MAKRRKHGDGSVRLRKDGRWEGRVVIGYDEKGLPKTKNVLAKTKTECAAKLRALRERLTPPAPEVPKADLSLGNWLDHWYQDYKKATLRPNTQMSYERRIYQHIIPALGNIQLDKLTTGDIQQILYPSQAERQAAAQGALWRGSLRPDRPGHPHHPPRRSGQGGGGKADLPQPCGQL